MPPGTPYNSFVLPYRIRVDDFGQSTTGDCAAALHLLTHTHSDHTNGLSAQSFGYTVICSKDSKEMLLRHEVYAERKLRKMDLRAQNTRTYGHLKVDPQTRPDGTMYYAGSRDLLKAVSLDTPIQQELSDGEFVTITLLNANHCPGAVMFLIEGAKGAILHTGDFRAEPWFLDSLTRNPSLQPYLAPRNAVTITRESDKASSTIVKTLEAIYLDTACVLSKLSVPSKERATAGLVELMRLFPETVYFFINMWTWGYEDILKAIAREFGSQIHVDRYKFSIFQCISDPFLRAIVTQDSSSTRFHACERFHRCEYVAVDNEPGKSYSNAISHLGRRVVYVNPVTMGSAGWDLYLRDTKERLLNGEILNNLLVPLSRHSPLTELRDFVALFRPLRVVPNTLDPRLQGFDWRAINKMFADCLHPNMTYAEQPMDAPGLSNLHQVVEEVAGDMDVALKNLVGDGAADLAKRWAENGKLRQRLEIVRAYLGPMENSVLDGLLGVKPSPPEESGVPRDASFSRIMSGKGKEKAVMRFVDSEDESYDGFIEDERGKTAHQLFASLAGIEETEHVWWVSSPASQKRGTWVLDELGAKKVKSIKDSSPISGEVGTGAPWAKRLTPVSSPVHASPTSRLLPPHKRRQPASTFLSCTPPALRKRLFAEDCALGSPIHITSLRTRSDSISDAINTDPCTAGPVALSGRLPPRTQQHPDPPLSPLLEVNNYSPKRIGSLAPPPTCETRTALKQKFSNTGRSIIHFSSGDENLASDVTRSARIVGEFHRSPSPRERPAAPGITPPSNLSSEMKEKNLRASLLRARRLKLNAHRLGIAERLARARPDLVAPTYEAKRAVLLARDVKARERAQARKMGLQKEMMKAHLEATGTVSSIETNNDDGGMGWERGRVLAEEIRADGTNGSRPILPLLTCRTDGMLT